MWLVHVAWLYWSALGAIAFLGVAVIVLTCIKPRGWWWKLPLAMFLIVGPYWLDLIVTRVAVVGESPLTAWLPTTSLVSMMTPEGGTAYGAVFDRFHKAPPRHAMWDSQVDAFAEFSLACVREEDVNIAKRGVQLAGTFGHRSDAAIEAIREALGHKSFMVRRLALDVIWGLGERGRLLREDVKGLTNDYDDVTREKAIKLLPAIGEGD